MKANYNDDSLLFERCIHLIDEVFPGCKAFSTQGEKYGASWRKASTPFIIEEEGEIVAHAGAWPITLMLNGKIVQTASIHGVCVKPEFRGKGHFKVLMQEVIDYVNANFDFPVFFTMKPYLYKKYPYKPLLPEYDFVVNEKLIIKSKLSDLRKLDIDDAQDLKLLHYLLSNRIPLSHQLSVLNSELFIFSMLGKPIYYSEKLNAIIVYEIRDKTLYFKEIISQTQHHLTKFVELISESFERIVLQFCADNLLNEDEYEATLAGPECCIMGSNSFSFEGKYFRYPELYWC